MRRWATSGLLSGSKVSFEVEAGAFEGDGHCGGAVVEEQARGEESRRLGKVGRHFLFEYGTSQLVDGAQPDRRARGGAPDCQGQQPSRRDRESGTEIHEGRRPRGVIADKLPVRVRAAFKAEADRFHQRRKHSRRG